MYISLFFLCIPKSHLFLFSHRFTFHLISFLFLSFHSMLAVVGNLVTYSGTRLEGMEDMPSGFAALSPSAWANNPVAKSQIYGMVLTFAFLEFFVMKDQFGTAESPGDYRNGVGVTVWDKFDDKTKQRKRAIEINNGRAAQMGILGLMVHEKMGNIADILPGASS